MEHGDVLKAEYHEQFQQYRWIGQMQVAVLAFYGTVAGFSFFAATAARAYTTAQPPDYRLLGVVLVIDGFLGVFVSVALLYSRAMQTRVGKYIGLLVQQLASGVDGWISNESALRFRPLCQSGGLGSLLDTMNTAFYLAGFSGAVFLGTGTGLWLNAMTWVSPFKATILALAVILVLGVSFVAYTRAFFRKARHELHCKYLELDRRRGIEQIGETK